MIRNRASTLALSIALGFAVGIPIPARADDTEIYLGNAQVAADLRPNILFVLDTSRSMNREKDGQPQNRMTRMKRALNQVLDQIDNVNVGLMLFEGGNRLAFPVTNIDADSQATTLLRRVSAADDDAEESRPSGKVELHNPTLELGDVPPVSVTTQLAPNPLRESPAFLSNGLVGISPNDTTEPKRDPDSGPFGNVLEFSPRFKTAMRFENLPIPPGVTITHAAISFEPLTEDAVATTMIFSGHKVADSPALPTGFNLGQPLEPTIPVTVADRLANATTAKATWDPVPVFELGSHPESVELKSIVQEIIDLPGPPTWAQGNAITFMVETPRGIRRARTIESTATQGRPSQHRATLNIEYEAGGTPGAQFVGLRFRDVRLPQGIKIKKAVLELRPSENTNAPVDIRIRGELPTSSMPSAAPFARPDGTPIANTLSSSRPLTSKYKDWKLGAGDPWTQLDHVQTPDLTKVVQEIVDQRDWCGGNDMAFVLQKIPLTTKIGPRSFSSFDNDPNLAPVLRVEFEPRTGAGWRKNLSGCTVVEIARQVNASNDDAEQDVNLGSLSLVSPTLEFFTDACCTRANGLRFAKLNIPSAVAGGNVKILSAAVTLTAAKSGSEPTSVNIFAQKIGDAPPFDEGRNDVLSRMQSASQLVGPILWNATTTPSIDISDTGSGALNPGWKTGQRYTSPDISPLLQRVVDGVDWRSGNAIALLLNGTGRRVADSIDGNPFGAARLRVKFRVNLAPLSPSERIFNTVRQALEEVVNGIVGGGETPIVDSLYESARYFGGKSLDFGLLANPHPASYKGGDIKRLSGCDEFNPQSLACAGTRVVGDPVATYISPITDACQSNFIVLLTDGDATVNESVAGKKASPARPPIPATPARPPNVLPQFIGRSGCPAVDPSGNPTFALDKFGNTVVDNRCGIELVKYLHDKDQLPAPDGIGDSVNTVSTYTIGFARSSQWLTDLATAGGGRFFTATKADDLARVFQQIFALVQARTTSFATPSLSINAFNKLFHRDEVYFSLFQPSEFARWPGNVKKYKIRTTCRNPANPAQTLPNCEVGEIIDAKASPEPAIGEDQRIRDTALSQWTDPANPDGAKILKGGSGAEYLDDSGPFYRTRRVFTWVGDTPPAAPVRLDVPSPKPATAPNLYLEIKDADGDGILDGLPIPSDTSPFSSGLGGFTPGKLFGLERTRTLLGVRSGSTVAQLWSAGDVVGINDLVTVMNRQINWIRGQDVDDDDGDGSRVDDRYSFTDPLHSSPVAVTYGSKFADNPATPNVDEASVSAITKLFVGTNDGGIRMLNASDEPAAGGNGGKEQWIFYPQSTLQVLWDLRNNLKTPQHKYGVDGTPTIWVNDVNGDGTVDPTQGDFVRMYIGMRRGGNQIFAFDVTPDAVLSDPAGLADIVPKLLWRIDGNSTEFPRLGDTWSRPRLATIRYGTNVAGESFARKVLIFAGGYDKQQDGTFAPGGTGNAIYIVAVGPTDPNFPTQRAGQRLLSISSAAPPADASGNISGDHVEVPDLPGQPGTGMSFPIPSDVALLDSDGDGAIDRLYVGDTGGQMWRVDLAANTKANEPGIVATVGKLASVSSGDTSNCPDPSNKPQCDQRKFFYPPDVVQVRNDGGSSIANYDLVVAVTGRRPSPLDTSVQDRAYGFKDLAIGASALIAMDSTPPDGSGDGDGIAEPSEGYTTLQGPLDSGATGDLIDVTDPNTLTSNASGFRDSDGWYLDFAAAGEKALAAPVILAGKLFFTTYLPEGVVANVQCAIPEGGGQLYGVNVLTGEAVFNWASNEGDTKTAADRTMKLGGGIPSGAVPIFQPEAVTLLIGGGGGATTVDPDVALPRQRTYWFQQ